jgi:chemotaxis protein histidine kinase CheA
MSETDNNIQFEVVEEPEPEVAEEPEPEVVEEPEPEVVDEPEPEVVEEPEPEVVEEPEPEVVEEPEPEVAEEPEPEVAEEPEPEVAEEPEPEVVEEPEPEVIQSDFNEPAQPEENNLYDTPDPVVEEKEPIQEPEQEVVSEETVQETEPEVIQDFSPEIVSEPAQPEENNLYDTPEQVVSEETVPEPEHEVIQDFSPEIVSEPAQPEENNLYDTPEQVAFEPVQELEPEVIEESLPDAPTPAPAPIPVPSLIFVIPYRDREQHLAFFKNHMTTVILKDVDPATYEFLVVHQNDTRSFNRGAMKNIGFLHVRAKYPNDYEKITLVFNDVDTMPYTNMLDYKTQRGTVKHFYGYTYALGGIFSINAKDFEETGGFPNFWAWGYEDNAMNKRVIAKNLAIDRSVFFPIMDKNILQLKDGVIRLVNRGEYDDFKQDHMDAWSDIHDINTSDFADGFLHVNAFNTVVPRKTQDTVYDMTKSRFPFPQKRRGRMGMFF